MYILFLICQVRLIAGCSYGSRTIDDKSQMDQEYLKQACPNSASTIQVIPGVSFLNRPSHQNMRLILLCIQSSEAPMQHRTLLLHHPYFLYAEYQMLQVRSRLG